MTRPSECSINLSFVFGRWRDSLLDTVALNDPKNTEFASSLCDALGVNESQRVSMITAELGSWVTSQPKVEYRSGFHGYGGELVSEWRHSPELNTDLVSMVTVENWFLSDVTARDWIRIWFPWLLWRTGFWVTSQPGIEYGSGFHGYGGELVSEWRHSPGLNADLVSMVTVELGFWVASEPGLNGNPVAMVMILLLPSNCHWLSVATQGRNFAECSLWNVGVAFLPSFGPETAQRTRCFKHDNFHLSPRHDKRVAVWPNHFLQTSCQWRTDSVMSFLLHEVAGRVDLVVAAQDVLIWWWW